MKTRIIHIEDDEIYDLANRSGLSIDTIRHTANKAIVAVGKAGYSIPRKIHIMIGFPGITCSYRTTGVNSIAVHLDPVHFFDPDCPVAIRTEKLEYALSHEIAHPSSPIGIMEMFHHSILRKPFGFGDSVDGINHAINNSIKDLEIDTRLLNNNPVSVGLKNGFFGMHGVEYSKDQDMISSYSAMYKRVRIKGISASAFPVTRLSLRILRRAAESMYMKKGLCIMGSWRQFCTNYGRQFHQGLKGILNPPQQDILQEIYLEMLAGCHENEFNEKRIKRLVHSFRTNISREVS